MFEIDSTVTEDRPDPVAEALKLIGDQLRQAQEQGQRWSLTVTGLDFEWPDNIEPEKGKRYMVGMLTGMVMQLIVQPNIDHLDPALKTTEFLGGPSKADIIAERARADNCS